MNIVKPGYEILTPISKDGMQELKHLERIARICYKSSPIIAGDEYLNQQTRQLIDKLIKNDHTAMLEHGGMSVLFTCDRGVSHELVRHRMASFAQESTRWCNYSLDKFGNEISIIRPYYLHEEPDGSMPGEYWWVSAMEQAEESYFEMLNHGYSPQEARATLPNSLKTEIVVTANWREWRHIFTLRCARDAHPQMKEIMIPLLCEMRAKIPTLFKDIPADWAWYAKYLGFDDYEVYPSYISLWSKDDPTAQKTWPIIEEKDSGV